MRQICLKHLGKSGPARGWTRLAGLLVVMLAGLGAVLPAAGQSGATTQVQLILSADAVKPGDTVTAGIRLRMKPKEHVYWRNPGTGIPTAIAWKLPPGIKAGEIQWPVPEKLIADDLTSYIYDDEVVLLVPLKVAADAASGPLTLKADVSWLECAVDGLCVPGKKSVEAVLTVGAETKSAADAGLIETWRKRLPATNASLAAKASWEKTANGNTRPVIFEWAGNGPANSADFFPDASDDFDVLGKVETLSSGAGKIQIRKQIKKGEGNWPAKISGLLVQKTGAEPVAYEVSLPIGGEDRAALPGAGKGSLLGALLGAFLGGLVLNIMPCVLPVIALKILGFVGQSNQSPARTRKLGLIYAAGVLASFLALAGLVIGVKAAGHAASWGMQLQNPQTVVLLTVLITLVALNLFGVFEVNLGGRAMGAAGNLAAKEGAAGAFFNGILATVLATPCTAPFLAGALGFAFKQSAAIIVLFFLTIGAGLAAPYVILSWQPKWLKFLPKPGVWMERFKVIMGFPVLATAVWLFTLATPNFGGNGDLWLGLFLVLLALTAWVWGQFVQRGQTGRGWAMAASVAIFVFAYGYVLERQLDWRHPAPVTGDARLATAPAGIEWQPWSPEALAAARATGRPILVDFTAKWCLTCQTIVRPALESAVVRKKLQQINAIALLEDSNDLSGPVAAELARYEQAGVPLVLVYPSGPESVAEIVPVPAFSSGIMKDRVLAALDRAAKPASSLAASNKDSAR
jgi:thiol:disulfide interchange protein